MNSILNSAAVEFNNRPVALFDLIDRHNIYEKIVKDINS